MPHPTPTESNTRQQRSAMPWLPWLVVLASCSAPPKPPLPDERERRPVNSTLAVELQACRSDLANSRIAAAEAGRVAEHTHLAMQRMASHQQVMAAVQATLQAAAQADNPATDPGTASARANVIHVLTFPFGSSRVEAPAAALAAMVEDARQSPLVLLRGRTDGSTETPGESRTARERAQAVRAFLIGAGVDPSRIRLTWQPVGDTLADNDSPAGRSLNRRVEVEVYPVLPNRRAVVQHGGA